VTKDELDAIEARAAQATRGPWTNEDGKRQFIEAWAVIATKDGSFDVVTSGLDWDDAEFIAHAREDVPALVAEVRRLRQQVLDFENDDQERHEGCDYDQCCGR
jgi:hypothetical protein